MSEKTFQNYVYCILICLLIVKKMTVHNQRVQIEIIMNSNKIYYIYLQIINDPLYKDLWIFLKWFSSRWETQLKFSRFPSTSYLDETLSELICWPRDCWALLLTVHRVLQHEIRDVLTALYSVLIILYSLLCTLYFIFCTLYSVFSC